MKKIILALAVSLGGVICAHAQGVKGNFFGAADIGSTTYSSNSESTVFTDGGVLNQDVKTYSIDISPMFGWYLSDHTIFGGTLVARYEHDTNDKTSTETGFNSANITTNTGTYKIGPFLRYYFFAQKPTSTMFFLQGAATIGTGTSSSTSAGVTENEDGLFSYDLRGAIGITHYFTKNVGLDIGLAYDYEHLTYNDDLPATTGKFTNNAGSIVLSAGFTVAL